MRILLVAIATGLFLASAACERTPEPDPVAQRTSQSTSPSTSSGTQTSAQTTPHSGVPAEVRPQYDDVSLADVKALGRKIDPQNVVSQPQKGLGDGHTEPVPGALRHAAFRGPAGPYPKAVTFFDDYSDNALTGWIFAERDGEPHGYRLFYQIGYISSVDAVFFEDIHEDGDLDILVAFMWMTGMGPEGAKDRYHVVAFTWDQEQQRFVTNDLFDPNDDNPVGSAAEARKQLAERGLIRAAGESK
jgi:hypothetical protein